MEPWKAKSKQTVEHVEMHHKLEEKLDVESQMWKHPVVSHPKLASHSQRLSEQCVKMKNSRDIAGQVLQHPKVKVSGN